MVTIQSSWNEATQEQPIFITLRDSYTKIGEHTPSQKNDRFEHGNTSSMIGMKTLKKSTFLALVHFKLLVYTRIIFYPTINDSKDMQKLNESNGQGIEFLG
ncbi:uncharacterized protein PHALS_08895 [Plasmopara halstedii]|uniref:Uncharacterized protein n=1 Tax=Plasmopara halstedii TaxID=4781 RepID=A0A0P1AEM8_PLAHL|nr:uncharacterized protein PHALS_08895 [Plasmopara halstedii]CEG38845.1 hypothetical protein PHALS_08895 [Plasmopara halstedii]|eukprot:XP_024575214.1 hypothetical protein PHALS_08895 [Plasmopara halstedii]